MILDTKTGFSEEDQLGAEADRRYMQYLQEVERVARDTLPPGALFSVGNLSDGTGHGGAHVWVQGEHMGECDVLARRFPRLVVSPLTQPSYDALAQERSEKLQELQRHEQVARVREEVEKVCSPGDILFDIHAIACQVGQHIAVIVYVQGEHRDRIDQWLIAVFGTNDNQIDVRPLSCEQYFDLYKRKKGQQPLARAAQAL